MRFSNVLQALLLLGAVVLILTMAVGVPEAAAASFRSVSAATPAMLQQSGANPSLWNPGLGGGPPRLQLPNSTFPTTPDVFCSVDADPSLPNCSVNTAGSRCTAQVDDGPFCSVFGAGATGAGGSCSTSGAKAACSVLNPAHTSSLQPISGCSVLGPGAAPGDNECSTLTKGRKQACSVENPSQFGNACSSFGPNASCSVLNNQGARKRAYCSAFKPSGTDPQLCSTFSEFGSPSSCSVELNGSGVCTALKLAAPNTCSAHMIGAPGAGFDHCSVIGGAAGGPVCRQ